MGYFRDLLHATKLSSKLVNVVQTEGCGERGETNSDRKNRQCAVRELVQQQRTGGDLQQLVSGDDASSPFLPNIVANAEKGGIDDGLVDDDLVGEDVFPLRKMPRHLLAAHGRHVCHDDDHVSLPRVCDVVADGGQLRARGQERRRVMRVQQAEEGDGQTVDVRRVSRRGGRHAQSQQSRCRL